MLPFQMMLANPLPSLPLAFSMFPFASVLVLTIAVAALGIVLRGVAQADRASRRAEPQLAEVRPLRIRSTLDLRSHDRPLAA